MSKHLLRGAVLAGVLILVLLLAGGAWWFFMGQYTTGAVPPASPIQVFLLSPSSGEDVAAGDLVLVNLQTVAPGALSWAEVFVDGRSLGAVTESPETVSWTWQAWPTGIHVLSGRALAADGQMGESQTVIVNVVATDATMQVQAGASETLEQVGARFGVPAVQMAGANPSIDATKPLADGQAVRVPLGASNVQPAGGQGAPGVGSSTGDGTVPFYINWELHLTGHVDRSYCYVSDGSGEWDKMPRPPFEFFGGVNSLYTQMFDATPAQGSMVQAQCWGWAGGSLQYLGQADARMTPGSPIRLTGDGFLLSGEPNWPEGRVPEVPESGLVEIPAPYAVRKTDDPSECFSHKGTLELCKQAIGNPTATSFVLVWEWVPHFALGGNIHWQNAINGYRVYEIDPATGIRHSMKTVNPAAVKMALLPLPSGKSCYGVEAYAESKYGVTFTSDMVTYCPGTEPPTKKIVLKPVSWLSTGHFAESQVCDFKEHLHGLVFDYNEARPNDLMVGSIFQQDEGCQKEADVAAAVKFVLPPLPGGAVVQDARLRFAETYNQYYATGVAANVKLACAGGWGISKQDWTGLGNAKHYIDYYQQPNPLGTMAYYKPLDSLSGWDHSPEVDVKWQVVDWIEDPASNHGFILIPRMWPVPAAGPQGTGACFSQFGGFELEISYYTP